MNLDIPYAHCPEIAFALGVIVQAFHDIRARTFATDRRGGATRPARTEVAWAWEFLTAESGAWYDARRLWCQCAGLHPERVREAALAQPRPDTRSQSSGRQSGGGV